MWVLLGKLAAQTWGIARCAKGHTEPANIKADEG